MRYELVTAARVSALTGLLLLTMAGVSFAAEIRVLSAGAVREAVSELAEKFGRETGHQVQFTFGTVGTVLNKMAGGETADVLVLTAEAMAEQERRGTVIPGSRADLGRVMIGLAVKEGAPLPDISTPEALRQTLLAARSLVYADPKAGATSGIHFAGVLERLGIAEAVKAKTTLLPGGYVVEPVGRGEIEVGVHQITEILPVKGVTLVGPLPQALQKVTTYTAALVPGTSALEPAQAFIKFLTSPAGKARFEAHGFSSPN